MEYDNHKGQCAAEVDKFITKRVDIQEDKRTADADKPTAKRRTSTRPTILAWAAAWFTRNIQLSIELVSRTRIMVSCSAYLHIGILGYRSKI
jgi:hypothetical protein